MMKVVFAVLAAIASIVVLVGCGVSPTSPPTTPDAAAMAPAADAGTDAGFIIGDAAGDGPTLPLCPRDAGPLPCSHAGVCTLPDGTLCMLGP